MTIILLLFIFLGLTALVTIFAVIFLIKLSWLGISSLSVGGVLLLVGAILFLVHADRYAHRRGSPPAPHGPHHLGHRHFPSPPHDPGVVPRPESAIRKELGDQALEKNGKGSLEYPDLPKALDNVEPIVIDQPKAGTIEPIAVGLPPVGIPVSITETSRDKSGTIVNRHEVTAVPDWTKMVGEELRDGITTLVMQSQRFATAAEARQQLFTQLSSVLQERLSHSFEDIENFHLSLKEVEQTGVIRAECDIVWPISVGEFTEQVHQVSWRIEISPQSQQSLIARARPQIVQARVRKIAILFGAITTTIWLGALICRRPRSANVTA